MRIDLVFPALPPAINGIGDHTARLASALGDDHRVRVWSGTDAAPLPATPVRPVIGPLPGGVRGLAAIADDPPDWLLVQYNPFSYGRWGFAPHLPAAIARLRRAHPELRIALMVHEPFVPITNWKWAIETTWQRAQLWALGRQSDLVLCSIQPWARRFSTWFPHAPVVHLPVGSNIPDAGTPPAEAKRRLGFGDELVVGVFGSAHHTRRLPFVRAVVEALGGPAVLYVGPDGATVREALPHAHLHDAGPLPGPDVSAHLSAMDVHLCPFEDGVSTRRGSFMAGLQHGVPSVSTAGAHTDGILLQHTPRALRLTPDGDAGAFVRAAVHLAIDADARAATGAAGRALYEQRFGWDRAAATLLDAMLQAEALTPTASEPAFA